jgi:hypothetical protein
MREALELYSSQRKKHYETIKTCKVQLTEIDKECKRLTKQVERERNNFRRALHDKVQARRKKKAEREEERQEKRERKQAKLPDVYRVRITIEIPPVAGTDETTQVKSTETEASEPAPPQPGQEATLTLTYTTSSASWTPHYDLRLDTTNPSRSTLTYRAHFTNCTSETWSNAQLTLSTSQASFGGLNEKIPRMESWRVALAKAWSSDVQRHGLNGLFSLDEQKIKEAEQKELYEVPLRQARKMKVGLKDLEGGITQSMERRGRMQSRPDFLLSSLLEIPSTVVVPPPLVAAQEPAAVVPPPIAPAGAHDQPVAAGGGGAIEDEADGATLAAAGALIAHAPAGADTYGFTTTYELPTPRTVPSATLIRRHVIAEIPLPNLAFTHVAIPKLKPAAFLKAKLNNASTIPLLPGVAGLTLDGFFLGNLAFPRCSPEETVVLELGVDQSVKVEYERPTVKRASQGVIVIGKEEVGVFSRTMRITNTKSASVSLVVLDQVPVPEDEKLKVTILSPKGLRKVDDVATIGVGEDSRAPTTAPAAAAGDAGPRKPKAPVEHAPTPSVSSIPETALEKTAQKLNLRRFPSFSKRSSVSPLATTTPIPPVPRMPAATASAGTDGGGWGTAKATLRKNGQVRFDVDLLKSGCVSIELVWECRMPSGDGVQALS